MPFIDDDQKWLPRLISITGSTLYPLCLSLLLPIFMFTLVHEKDEQLLIMMKMNGLKMHYYWFVTILFFLFISFVTYGIFYFVGR